MDIRQLEYLVAVVDEGSFTRAAERLHVAQPAVSASLARLERELGVVLLDRSGGVSSTAVGADVLGVARQALAAFSRVRQVVDEHQGLLTGSVSIGVVGSVVVSSLPAAMSDFARQHPAVELHLQEGTGMDQIEALRRGDVDIAMVGMIEDPPAGVESLLLEEEAMVAAVGESHELAGRRRVRLAELVGQRLMLMPPGTAIRHGLDEIFRRRGLRPDLAHVAATPILLGEMAARGLGVAIVPETVLPYVEGLRGIRLVDPTLRARRYLLWSTVRPASPAAAAFLRLLRGRLDDQLDGGGERAPGLA